MSETKRTPPFLNSNDIALAAQACAHTIQWWRKHGCSKYARDRIASLQNLITKLDKAGDHLCPYSDSDDMPDDWGAAPVYGPLTKRQQRAAIAKAEGRS